MELSAFDSPGMNMSADPPEMMEYVTSGNYVDDHVLAVTDHTGRLYFYE